MVTRGEGYLRHSLADLEEKRTMAERERALNRMAAARQEELNIIRQQIEGDCG